jgi:hypothetical protein
MKLSDTYHNPTLFGKISKIIDNFLKRKGINETWHQPVQKTCRMSIFGALFTQMKED